MRYGEEEYLRTYSQEEYLKALNDAFDAGLNYCEEIWKEGTEDLPDKEEFIRSYMKETVVEEETIPITYGLIKATCGWSQYCDVTGGNHYAVKEYGIGDNEIFDVKLSHAKELSFI